MTAPSVLSVLGAKGFRVFFLLAGAHAAVVAPLWVAVWTGRVALRGPLQGIAWHAHEMIFGFALAVVAGFLLTAVGNWTGRDTATGAALFGLGGVWLAARVTSVAVPGWPAAAVDLAFLPLLGVAIGRPLIATSNRRNYVFLGILAALWAADAAVWLDVAGALPGAATLAHRVAVYVVALLILVMAARIVPMFTRNTTGVASIRNVVPLDVVAAAATAVVAGLQAWPGSPLVSPVAAVAGVATLARMATWGTRHTLRHPLLWVLHLGHASVGIGLCLLALQPWVTMPATAPLHTVTVGAIGLLTLGMMARVSLGHSGRPIVVGPAMALAFGGVAAAALVRVTGPWVAPAWTTASLWTAAVLWTVGFALFVVRYAGVLTRPRVDGRPG